MNKVYFDGHVRGVSHEAKDVVCQDFSGTREVEGARGTGFVIVVADGHGDPTCRRSDRGSRLAVGVALACLSNLAQSYLDADEDTWHLLREGFLCGNATESDTLSAQGDVSTDDARSATPTEVEPRSALAFDIVEGWRAAAKEDYVADPLPEFTQAMEESDEAWRTKAMCRLYGTTLVAALMLPDLCVLLQQGDGCSTVLFADGRSPLACGDVIPEDELCVGNVTTSLSDMNAAERMRVAVLDSQTDPVAALFVGTDGVDKSLPGKDGASDLFAGIALDVLGRVEGDGWDGETFDGDLEGMMRRLSRSGSGDDVSIAAVIDVDLVQKVAAQLGRERDAFDLKTTVEQDKARLGSMKRKYEYYLMLDSDDEVTSRERDAYLSEYRRLEQRIRSLERDLGRSNEDKASNDVTDGHARETDDAEQSASESPHAFVSSPGSARTAFMPAMRVQKGEGEEKLGDNVRRNTPGRIAIIALIVVLACVLVGIASFLITTGIVGTGSQNAQSSVSEQVDEPVNTDGALVGDASSADGSAAVPGDGASGVEMTSEDGAGVTQPEGTEVVVQTLPDDTDIERVVDEVVDLLSYTDGKLSAVPDEYEDEKDYFDLACRESSMVWPEGGASYDERGNLTLPVRFSCVDLRAAVNEVQKDASVEDAGELLSAMADYLEDSGYAGEHKVSEEATLTLVRDASGAWTVTEESRKILNVSLLTSMNLSLVTQEANQML